MLSSKESDARGEKRPNDSCEDHLSQKKRVTRRRHRNSRLGCDECKKRRIKCDETLPECRNCQNRQKRGAGERCSYLSMSEEEIASFKTKRQQNQLAEGTRASKALEEHPEKVAYEIKMIAHESVELPVSVWNSVSGMESVRVPKVLYLQLLLNANQDWNMSSRVFVVLALYAIINSMSHKITLAGQRQGDPTQELLSSEREILENIAVKYKKEFLSYAREIISLFLTSKSAVGSELLGTRLLITNTVLQYIQLYSNAQYDSNHYAAMVDMCLEIYKNNDPDKVARTVQFYWSAMPRNLFHLYFPAYSTDLLFELKAVLQEFEACILSADDDRVQLHYNQLIDFLQYVIGLLPISTSVLPLPINKLYEVYRTWFLGVPSEAFCISRAMPAVHRVFYTFYHSVASYLNHLFPSGCYLMSRPFHGPTSLYPFSLNVVFEDLDHVLGPFAEFSVRLLSFMERREHILQTFFEVKDPLPPELDKFRFQKREVRNLKEKFISSLREELITWDNYPDLVPDAETSEGDEVKHFALTEREIAKSPIKRWRQAKDNYKMPAIFPSENNEILMDQILEQMKSADPFLAMQRKTPVDCSGIEYFSDRGYQMGDRGLFQQDCDVSLFFEQCPPAFLSTLPTVEEVLNYKVDRICVLSNSDNQLLYNY
ncbi:LAQU0S01e13058g1_1 [Lachancea quebecensis]|uniref:LAQU0S01e13058g1_1 n=1 Tax=Lachancea quebecensis TaxID=1654605 RepID=A0A0P1KLY6_9SACH|nr:LAQU0S01e13058g1_1 [Lachancea quebecensis]